MCKGISDHQKAGEMAQEADGDEAERASFVSAMDSCSEAGEKPDFGGAGRVRHVRRNWADERRSGCGRPAAPPLPPRRAAAPARRAARGAAGASRGEATRSSRRCARRAGVLAALAAPPALGALLARQVRSELVVDSPSAPGYATFASNEGADGPLVLYELRMFDLANAEDVLHGGAPPKLVERGPYAYREYYRLLDVEFLDGGDAVSYCTWTYYVFDAARSAPGVAEDDVIVQSDLVLFGLAEALRPLPRLVDAALRALLDAHPEDWELAAAVLALQRWSGDRMWELLLSCRGASRRRGRRRRSRRRREGPYFGTGATAAEGGRDRARARRQLGVRARDRVQRGTPTPPPRGRVDGGRAAGGAGPGRPRSSRQNMTRVYVFDGATYARRHRRPSRRRRRLPALRAQRIGRPGRGRAARVGPRVRAARRRGRGSRRLRRDRDPRRDAVPAVADGRARNRASRSSTTSTARRRARAAARHARRGRAAAAPKPVSRGGGRRRLHGLAVDRLALDPSSMLSARRVPANAAFYQFGPDGLANFTSVAGAARRGAPVSSRR